MADLVIRFRRPATLPAGEEKAWMTARVRSRRADLARQADEPGGLALRVAVPPAASSEDRVTRLLLDGTLRPT